jgi:2-polyprenyl-6-methoxyphenol hydroxylase-like FAD-dependent oxidoreductase
MISFLICCSAKDAGDNPETTRVEFDFLLGCDGAHSMVRRLMQKYVRFVLP